MTPAQQSSPIDCGPLGAPPRRWTSTLPPLTDPDTIARDIELAMACLRRNARQVAADERAAALAQVDPSGPSPVTRADVVTTGEGER